MAKCLDDEDCSIRHMVPESFVVLVRTPNKSQVCGTEDHAKELMDASLISENVFKNNDEAAINHPPGSWGGR